MMISLNTTLPPASNATVASAGAGTIPGNLPLFAQRLSQTAAPAEAATTPVIEQPYAADAALPSQLRFATQAEMPAWQAGKSAESASTQDDAQTAEQRAYAMAHAHAAAPLEGLLPAMTLPVMAPAMLAPTEAPAPDETSAAPSAATAPAAGVPISMSMASGTSATTVSAVASVPAPVSMSAASTANLVAAAAYASPPAAIQTMQQLLPAKNMQAVVEPGLPPAVLQAFARGAGESFQRSLRTAADPAAGQRNGVGSAVFAMPAEAAPATPTAAMAVAAPAALRDGERTGNAAVTAPATATGTLLQSLSGAVVAPATGGNDTIKLNGPAQQWQEPLREALGDRLQTQIGRNSEHAVIRLDPPMLGRIEISIRHQAGALQVNLSASNSEVLRQLQGIGENMRSDLAQRQYTEVAVNINATPRSAAAQAFAEHDGRGQRQPGRQQDDGEPGRALSDGTPAGATFAMHEREYN